MTTKSPIYLGSVGRLLGFAHANCNTLSDRRLEQYGLTIRQWIPLTALWRESPLSESELARYCRMSASSLNRLLDRMATKRLILRSKDPTDKRRTLVKLGQKGQELSHLLDFYSGINKTLVGGLDAYRAKAVLLLARTGGRERRPSARRTPRRIGAFFLRNHATGTAPAPMERVNDPLVQEPPA